MIYSIVMNLVQTIILSIVEGISEFLPVSSTGHMILTSEILKIPQTEFTKTFEVSIQLGAILAVLFLYWKTLSRDISVWKKIIVAFLPTGFFGAIFYKTIKHYLLGNSLITIASLFIGGVILIILELLYKEKEEHLSEIEKLTYKKAFIIGIFQSVSMVPGVSRSAASIVGGLFVKLKRKTAVEFSFLLAVPTMLAATTLDLYKSQINYSGYDIFLLSAGFVGAFLTAILSVKIFISFVQKHTFIPFGIYRIVLSIIFYLIYLS